MAVVGFAIPVVRVDCRRCFNIDSSDRLEDVLDDRKEGRADR